MKEKAFVTINHLDLYGGHIKFKVGDKLYLNKDLDNIYDDEAIIATNDLDIKCGYVANSVYSVIRGSQSAGRIYEKIKDNNECIVRFIGEEFLIAELK